MQAIRQRVYQSQRGYPYYAVALYETRPRVKDGVETWRFVVDLELHGRALVRCTRRCEEVARDRGIPNMPGIRHGLRHEPHGKYTTTVKCQYCQRTITQNEVDEARIIHQTNLRMCLGCADNYHPKK